jgi:predicted lipoprotein
VANLGSTRRGMPVIEYLLYEVEGETATVFATDSRRCDYLRGLTADLATQASLMREAWDPSGGNYAAELAHAGEADTSGEFASVDLALQEVVNRLVFLTENIRSSKLGMPLGNRSGGFPLPDSAESRFSGRSLQDISDNLDGLESVVFGSGANGATSIVDYLEAGGDKELTEPLRAAFAQSRTALGLIAEPLVESVSGDADDIEAAISALGELQTLLQVDLIAALDLTLTFNDADGD